MRGMDITKEFSEKIAQATEKSLLAQLNDLVGRGLLVVEMGEMMMFTEPATMELKVQRTCRLTLKDREYVERLEKENEQLRGKLKTFADCMELAKSILPKADAR